MQQATKEIEQWMGSDPNLYAILTFHPGHGLPSFQIRLYEIIDRGGGQKITKNSVTEKGEVAEAAAKILLALKRWKDGDFDAVRQGPPQGSEVGGGDSGSHKRVDIP